MVTEKVIGKVVLQRKFWEATSNNCMATHEGTLSSSGGR
jgi:hypothetical protein